MPGNKKKKKPAANPARGFATTSVASKPKFEKREDGGGNSELTSVDGASTPVTSEDVNAAENGPTADETDLHLLSPEELEQQLEKNELQQLVETYGSKTRRECTRYVNKVQTDRRALRNQSQTLDTLEWLPSDILLEMLELASTDVENGILSTPTVVTGTAQSEEDTTIRLWTLQQILNELGFVAKLVEWALQKLLTLRSGLDATSSVWGIPEALDLLALECDAQELGSYDDPQMLKKKAEGLSSNNSRPETPAESPMNPTNAPSGQRSNNGAQTELNGSANPRIPSNADEQCTSSESDGDLEPEDLLPTYLSLKERLFKLNPDMRSENPKPTKKWKQKGVKAADAGTALSGDALRLQRKLQRIESDILFDKREADAEWNAMRQSLAQEDAVRRRLELPERAKETPHDATPLQNQASRHTGDNIGKADVAEDDRLLQQDSDAEDGGLFSGMFSAVPDDSGIATSNPIVNGDSSAVVIRDFGKQMGMNPRRIFEEACRARDSGAKVSTKHVSPTTYSSRHSLTVIWTKSQETLPSVQLPSMSCDCNPRSFTFTMLNVATPDTQQSEAYVSTAALFLVFSNSPKEEKAYLRLPSGWRDLWSEFTELKKDQIDSGDRESIKHIRKLVQDQHVQEEDQDVVIFGRDIRKRNMAKDPKPSETEAAFPSDIKGVEVSAALQQLWQRKSSSDAYKRMLYTRMTLPIFQFRQAALETISRNQVTILCGETGCGKSTQLPAFILEQELSAGRPCKIYCTEPRRISAISLAQRVSEELGEHKKDLGTSRSLVGYAIRLESYTSSQTRLVYATVGIVLRMLESSGGLQDITHLIIDEVHERSIDTDFLLVILRSLMFRRPELKVVLMSATVDAQKFSSYLDGAPIITVPGRTFPVQAMFLEDAIELTHHSVDSSDRYQSVDVDEDVDDDATNNTKSEAAKTLKGYNPSTRKTLADYDEYKIDNDLIIKLIKMVSSSPDYQDFSRAILVFLPGMAEIMRVNDMLLDDRDFGKGWLVYPLHSTIASEDQQQAFVIPPPGVRKIVLATNIAETGITIPDVTCVIDTGNHREMRFDERRQLSRLVQSFISRANAKQRRGRAGRVREGLCFHLFTKFRHDNLMAEQQTPEMLRLSLQDLVMRVKICKLGDIEETLSQALDPPSAKNIRRAIDALIEVDALTSTEELTHLGRQLARLPLDASLGKLVLLGSIFSCLDVAITIAAILSSKSPFNTPIGARARADAARLAFKRGDSDLLTAYNAYSAWRRVCTTQGISEFVFCKKNFLSPQNLANIEDLKSQLLTSLVDAGFVAVNSDERHAISRYRISSSRGGHRSFVAVPPTCNAHTNNDALAAAVIAWAFYPKMLTRDGKGWRNITNNQSITLHPTSVNKTSHPGAVKLLSYYHIMQASGRHLTAHATSATTPLPLLLLAGDAEFRMHAGVILLDGSRMRLAVRDWKTMIALKALRIRTREIVAAMLKAPNRPLGRKLERWRDLLWRIFEHVGSVAAEKRTIVGKS